MAPEIQHYVPSLKASVTGELDEGIALFRGLPYATVEKRWTHSRTNHSLPSPFDATKYGPRCTQGEGEVLVTGGVNDPIPGDDEFKCLNLNVTVPKEALGNSSSSGSLLPVMVWIHGGAFNYGANSVARYRPQQLCLLAQRDGNPMILVQIAYRLGPLGFVASDDLATELARHADHIQNGNTSPSILGNYGFVDQRNALEWVQAHIRDFGGNPSNVTAFGVSAGSASIHQHILTGDPMFDRAILMSGSSPSLGPLPFALNELAWQNFIKRTGVTGSTPAERLAQLRALSPEDVIKNYTTAAMGPMADGTLLPKSWAYSSAQKPTRCKSIIIGDTHIEAIIMDRLINSIPQAKFTSLARASLSDADAFFTAFGFVPDMSPIAYRDAMRAFLSVGMFQFSNLIVVATFPGQVYYYHFDEPSPYPGPTNGLAYHGQCALFVYQNGVHEYPDNAKKTAMEMGHLWTGFASGKVPWEEYSKAKRFMGLGPKGEKRMKDEKTDDVRQYKWMEWAWANIEEMKLFVWSLTKPTAPKPAEI